MKEMRIYRVSKELRYILIRLPVTLHGVVDRASTGRILILVRTTIAKPGLRQNGLELGRIRCRPFGMNVDCVCAAGCFE